MASSQSASKFKQIYSFFISHLVLFCVATCINDLHFSTVKKHNLKQVLRGELFLLLSTGKAAHNRPA